MLAQGQMDKENPKKSPLEVISWSHVVSLTEENGQLPVTQCLEEWWPCLDRQSEAKEPS